MCFSAIVMIVAWWNVAFIIVMFIRCKKVWQSLDPYGNGSKYEFEHLPVVYDDCNGVTARYVYLFRLTYGHRNKKFFIPLATITIDFLSRAKEKVATACLLPKVLRENHQGYLTTRQTYKGPFMLFFLLKRRDPIKHATLVLLNHDMHHGTIMVYNLFAVQLSDNTVFGSKIGKTISSLDEGFDMDRQTFSYNCLGSCPDSYIGPCLNLSLPETFSVSYLGMSIIFFFTTEFVLDLWIKSIEGKSKWLSHAMERSIFVSAAAIVMTLLVLIVYHYAVKQYCGKCCTVGFMWLINHVMPYLITFACITMDVITIRLLTLSEHSPLSDRQGQLWLIAVTSSGTIYLLVIGLTVMTLYLNGYYDPKSLPLINFETGENLESIVEISIKTKAGLQRIKSKGTNYSTRNIFISSSLHKKSKLQSCQAESISQKIKNYLG